MVEARSEIAGRRWMRQAGLSKGMEHDSFLAPQLDTCKALTATQDVVGDVQHVVGLVIRLVNLEHIHVAVDPFGQPDPPHHSPYRTHPSMRDPPRLPADLLLDGAAPPPSSTLLPPHRPLQPPPH